MFRRGCHSVIQRLPTNNHGQNTTSRALPGERVEPRARPTLRGASGVRVQLYSAASLDGCVRRESLCCGGGIVLSSCTASCSSGRSAIFPIFRKLATPATVEGHHFFFRRCSSLSELNPFRAPKSLPILTSSNLFPKKGFK